VQDHLSSHRRLAFRAVACQALVAVFAGAAAAGAISGRTAGMAAAIGAGSVAVANALQAQVALGGGVQPPSAVFLRLLLGTLVKWLVVVALWWSSIGVIGKAPLFAIGGLLAASLVHPLVVYLGTKVKRER
jgi:hypothetical protein